MVPILQSQDETRRDAKIGNGSTERDCIYMRDIVRNDRLLIFRSLEHRRSISHRRGHCGVGFGAGLMSCLATRAFKVDNNTSGCGLKDRMIDCEVTLTRESGESGTTRSLLALLPGQWNSYM